MVRFSLRKKLLEGGDALFEASKLANAHGRLLEVLRYLETAVSRPPPHGCLTVYRPTASTTGPPGRLKNIYP